MWLYLPAFLMGAPVGIGEIVSRYRDAPFQVLKQTPAAVYVIANGAASTAALWFINALNISFGVNAAANPQALN
jgi:hypothetical protein